MSQQFLFALNCPLCDDVNEVPVDQIIETDAHRCRSCRSTVHFSTDVRMRCRRLVFVRDAAARDAIGYAGSVSEFTNRFS